MDNLQIDVRDNGIRVSETGTDRSVTYRRIPGSQMLEAIDILRLPEIDASEAPFLAAAWKAAYEEARGRGWLGVMAV